MAECPQLWYEQARRSNVRTWGMQVHAAYGISTEYKIERVFRDAKMY
jgi:alkylation response protein AidB-like acyl-CoA dehydrogenase